MGAPTSVGASEALVRGANTAMIDTYEREIKEVDASLQMVMQLDVPSDKRSEIYPYFFGAPHPSRWPYGESVPEDAFGARNFQVVNYDYAIKVPYHRNDLADDQTGSLLGRVHEAGEGFGILQERLFFQVLTGATDLALLPAVPNAPDGVGLFSATDAQGAARFGIAGGNIVTGGGVATVAAVQTNLYQAIARFRQFQDGKGQPKISRKNAKKFVIVYGEANNLIFAQAFAQRFNQGTAAAPSNVILDGGLEFVLLSTPRITDNDWFVGLANPRRKAIFSQRRQQIETSVQDETNSDEARNTKRNALIFDVRLGIGVTEPHHLIQINN